MLRPGSGHGEFFSLNSKKTAWESGDEKMKTDEVNLNIRQHEEEILDTINWEYSERAKDLYRFFDLFNRRFFEGKLPIAAISFRSGRALGWYRMGRNEFGVKDQINLNSLYLERPRYQTLKTLLHEIIHEWQDYFGKHSAAAWYHNKQFQTKSKELGIPSDSRGHTIGIIDPFVAFCRQHGVDFSEHSQEAEEPRIAAEQSSNSKLQKYNCGCTNIWAATRVHAVCRFCGGEFERQ